MVSLFGLIQKWTKKIKAAKKTADDPPTSLKSTKLARKLAQT
jgi:hypothetical protein